MAVKRAPYDTDAWGEPPPALPAATCTHGIDDETKLLHAKAAGGREKPRTTTSTEEVEVLRCCDNSERRGFPRQGFYLAAYRARHRHVVARAGPPAVTYVLPERSGSHLASGWAVDSAPDASGTSSPHDGGPVHHWQRLTWTPPVSGR